MSQPGRRPTSRLLVSAGTTQVVETARIEAISLLRRDVSKTDIADALLAVGARHMDEVAALLKEETPG